MIKVVVILPVYKNDKIAYLDLSVESILRQSYNNLHLYIGIDGSIGKDLHERLKALEYQKNISLIWSEKIEGWHVF